MNATLEQVAEQAAWIAREAQRLAAVLATEAADIESAALTTATLVQELHTMSIGLELLGHDPRDFAPRIIRENGCYIDPVTTRVAS